jgi:dTMP kinase
LFLDVPFTFTQKSLQKDREGDDRAYLKGHKDIHEADLNFQKKVRDVYAWQAETGSLLKRIDCADERGAMLPPEKIFECIKNEITT